MKNLMICLSLFVSATVYSQTSSKPDLSTLKPKKSKDWSLGYSLGYINIPRPYIGDNVWTSLNLGYTKKNINVTMWGGLNYWVNEKQPDLRLGVTATYNILKW